MFFKFCEDVSFRPVASKEVRMKLVKSNIAKLFDTSSVQNKEKCKKYMNTRNQPARFQENRQKKYKRRVTKLQEFLSGK